MGKSAPKIALSCSRDIPLDKLVLSQSNVRRIKAGVSIEELAEDIARRTLLQSLTIRPVVDEAGHETGIYEIPAGGRRFRALELLVKQKRLPKNAPVPCVIRTEGLAEEDSLAENVQRAPLHPLDQFRAFQSMREKGRSEEEIAAAFFVSPGVVKQRLRLAAVEITPILDLLHFGVPDWLQNFQNPELPIHFSDYAAAVAERYPWVRFWTPVNEIYVTARVSAKEGAWNEQLKTDRGFVTALKHCVAASILATHEIARRRPDCVIVQSESAEYTHEGRATPSKETKLANKQRFISLDLLYAVPPDADTCHYLMDNGLTREGYDWFMAGEPLGYQIMGNDYYGRNERILKPDGTVLPAEDVLGWYQITKEYHARYRKPVMHTETNTFDAEAAPSWLWKQWMNVLRIRSDGVPVLGFTWYSLTDQIDWDINLREKRGIANACGLYDLQRQPRPVAAEYRSLLQEFGQITILPHGEVFEITDQPARLKVEV